MNTQLKFPRGLLGGRRFVLSAAAALSACVISWSACAQTASVVVSSDGKDSLNAGVVQDGLTEDELAGWVGNHGIVFGQTWLGSTNFGQPEVQVVPPTDIMGASGFESSQWLGGSNILGEMHASRLELAVVESELATMEGTLQQMQGTLATLSAVPSEASESGTFTSITVSGTTPWGSSWEGEMEPWTAYDSRNLAGCYQTELWIFGALLMFPIILKVKPA